MKQFIRNVRAAKTIADERAVVQKESAAIRASFKEEGNDSNVRSVLAIPSLEGYMLTTELGETMWQSCYISSPWVREHISVRSSA